MQRSTVEERAVERLRVTIHPSPSALAEAAADEAAEVIREAIDARGQANVMVASGRSHVEFLAALVAHRSLGWSRVNVFHLDEYLGLPPDHPASFRRFVREHLALRVKPRALFLIWGDTPEPEEEVQRYASVLRSHRLDLCTLGIGENGHLAFNEPGATDFQDPEMVRVVKLDEATRRQAVAQRYFASLDEVPRRAITVTVPLILSARRIVALCPERRKAEAVQRALNGPVTPQCPASVLRTAAHAHLFLDRDSASLL